METYIIIQARTGSTRLPNKMLKPFFKDKGILQILLERIKSVFPKDFSNLIVATTINPGDDRIWELCNKLGVKVYRGSESDVLNRFIASAEHFGADKIIRVCADNVFLDVDLLRNLYTDLEKSDCDYLSYCTSDGTPSIKTHYGFWAEGTTLNTLKRIAAATDDRFYHEHVTNYIYTHPEDFQIQLTNVEETIPGIESYNNLRLTIDTSEDFQISQEIYQAMIMSGKHISSKNIIKHVIDHPDYFNRMQRIINQNIK